MAHMLTLWSSPPVTSTLDDFFPIFRQFTFDVCATNSSAKPCLVKESTTTICPTVLQQQTTNHISHETLTCTNPIKNQKKNAQHSSLEDTQLISSLHVAKLFYCNFSFLLSFSLFLPASLSDPHKKLFSYSKCNRSTRLDERTAQPFRRRRQRRQ